MLRKFFVLTSVSALGGLVSAAAVFGCSETSDAPAVSDAGTADSSNTKEAGKPPTGGDNEPVEQLCYNEDPIDVTNVPYKPARIQPGACTPNVFDVMRDVFGATGGNVTYDEIKKEIATNESAQCADCVFGNDGDTWAPIVSHGDGNFTENLGGCFEVLSGKTECGKAIQQWMDCVQTACAACGSVRSEYDACTTAVQESACIEATQAAATSCGTATVNTYIRACFNELYVNNVGGTIQRLCVAGPKDAGTD